MLGFSCFESAKEETGPSVILIRVSGGNQTVRHDSKLRVQSRILGITAVEFFQVGERRFGVVPQEGGIRLKKHQPILCFGQPRPVRQLTIEREQ